jgi:predicted membrane-bound spermidine synthase
MLIFLIIWVVCSLLSLGLGIYCWYKLFNEVTLADVIFELSISILGPVALLAVIIYFFTDCVDFDKIIIKKRK